MVIVRSAGFGFVQSSERTSIVIWGLKPSIESGSATPRGSGVRMSNSSMTKAHAQFMGQLFLAEPQLMADFFDRLRKIFRCLCHIGLPQFLVRHQIAGGERTQFAQPTNTTINIAGDNACGKRKVGDYFRIFRHIPLPPGM